MTIRFWNIGESMLRGFAKPRIFFFTLIWLMILLVMGTIAEKYIGLYLSQKIYFSSFIIWIGGIIPAPGGYSVMTLIFINLLSKLIVERWTKQKIGTLITHCGALLLLLGGFLTASFSSEGSMVIDEGGTVNYVEDYHRNELAVTDTASGDEIVFKQNQLKPGAKLTAAGLTITPETLCQHCIITQRDAPLSNDTTHGMLVANDMRDAPLSPEEAQNIPGIIFILSGAGAGTDGRYGIFENMPIEQHLEIGGKKYTVALRRERTVLPFQVKLIKFTKDVYPGTDKPRAFQSEVIVQDGGLQWHSLISMNNPLRYKGYTFYQSSFIEQDHGTLTVLAVVKNIGAIFPYIASITLCIGLLVHMFIRIPRLKLKTRRGTLAILFLILFAPTVSHAADFDYSAFREIPVLHEGRVKPLESFARAYLLAFYGKSALPEMSADAWLAELLFDPTTDYQRNIFNIANPEVVNELGLPWRDGHHYSFDELSKAITTTNDTIKAVDKMDDAARTPAQRQLLELYDKVVAYTLISESLSLLQPRFHIHNADLAHSLHIANDQDLDFLELMPYENDIMNNVEKLKSKKPTELTPQEKERVFLALDYAQISQHQRSSLFRIMPPQWQMDGDEWSSPWATLIDGHGSPQSAEYLDLWQKLGVAYTQGDAAAWQQISQNIHHKVYVLAGAHASSFRQKLEVLYLQADLFDVVLAIYILSFVMLMIFLFSGQRFFYKTAALVMPMGALLHITNIAMRITIMSRPPVATLYETTIFVSFIAVLLSLLFEWKKRDATGLTVGSIIGTVLLFISMRYAADGDTMEMLVAVLNTNFWLATHVVAVTMGYGCSLVAGTLGHLYLINRATRPKDTAAHVNLVNTILAVTLIAAFFATLGTILGGIWADQSWGRFWGWDPKENGAMLIVLWLLWLLHGKIAGTLSPLNFASAAVLTNVIVALSWFGVNLLGVGLHSYGFTTNIAANLGAFCGGEILFVIIMRIVLTQRKATA
jgi:ABC-type transport system involved in cytochrome c biogenesis permease subunit